jgi:hypothetical protein
MTGIFLSATMRSTDRNDEDTAAAMIFLVTSGSTVSA